MKKYISGLILGIYISLTHAEIPKDITAFSASSAVCRNLFTEYNKKYDSNIVFFAKPGASGLIATQELVNSSKKTFSIMCGGLSETVFNNKTMPGHEALHDKLTMVTIIGTSALNFYARVQSPHQNLMELLATKSALTVGYASVSVRFAAEKMLKNYDITWVNFKNSNDALPSLLDGSLDVHIDGGALQPLVSANKLKSFGHVNGNSASKGKNLTPYFAKSLTNIKIFFAVITTNDIPVDDIQELNSRLTSLLNAPSVVAEMESFNMIPITPPATVDDSNKLVQYYKLEFNNVNR